MSRLDADPERGRRLLGALAMSFLITAVLALFCFVIGGLLPGSWEIGDFLSLGMVFLVVFLFWYFTCVWQTPNMAEFERLARRGEELLRHRSP
jgi:uncharacterized membrane protein